MQRPKYYSRKLRKPFRRAPVSAIGGNFFGEDKNDDYVPDDITINLSNGFSTTLSAPSPTDFNGFSVPTGSLSSFTVNTPVVGDYAIIDNLIVGEVVPSSVPEPGNVAMWIGLGTTGVGLLLLRRHKSIREAA